MKAIIVDDERIARQELRRLLTAHPEVEIAGEAANGEEAVSLVQRLEPDVLFLEHPNAGDDRIRSFGSSS